MARTIIYSSSIRLFSICPCRSHRHLFVICSSFVRHLFVICSSFVRLLFVFCSSFVRLLFVFCSSFVRHLFVFCSSFVRLLFVFCSFIVCLTFPLLQHSLSLGEGWGEDILFVFSVSSLYLHYFILSPPFANSLINSSTNFIFRVARTCLCGSHRFH